jgi:hypothetical protein
VHPRNQTFAMDRSLLIFIAIDWSTLIVVHAVLGFIFLILNWKGLTAKLSIEAMWKRSPFDTLFVSLHRMHFRSIALFHSLEQIDQFIFELEDCSWTSIWSANYTSWTFDWFEAIRREL